MRKFKFTLPLIIALAILSFAFKNAVFSSNKIPVEEQKVTKTVYDDTYFVFNGSSMAEYTDSTKWTKSSSNPNPSCPGDSIACLVKSATLTTRTELVEHIQQNDGEISGEATIEDKKAAL